MRMLKKHSPIQQHQLFQFYSGYPKVIVRTAYTIVLLLPCLASAHGGGLDAQGGHRDRQANNYHFHQGPLDGQTYASKDAATEALAALESGEESDAGLADPPRASSTASLRPGPLPALYWTRGPDHRPPGVYAPIQRTP